MKQKNQKAVPIEDPQVDESRRNLLKGIATAAVVGGVAATASKTVKADESKVAVEPNTTTGYRETQHIRDYYETL